MGMPRVLAATNLNLWPEQKMARKPRLWSLRGFGNMSLAPRKTSVPD